MDKRGALFLSMLALVAVALMLVFARGGQPVEVKVTLTDHRIDASVYEVRHGELVRLMIKNEGHVEHELEIEGYNLEVEGIQPGETRSLTFRADKAGIFNLVCHLEDHYEQGMKAEFRVSQ